MFPLIAIQSVVKKKLHKMTKKDRLLDGLLDVAGIADSLSFSQQTALAFSKLVW